MTPSPEEVSQLLRAWSNGEKAAFDKVIPLVYQELRQIAQRYMDRQQAGHTLQATALIHEAYLRLADHQPEVPWQNRAHFLGVAAKAMRNLLVDYARASQTAKRGGEAYQVSLDETAAVFS